MEGRGRILYINGALVREREKNQFSPPPGGHVHSQTHSSVPEAPRRDGEARVLPLVPLVGYFLACTQALKSFSLSLIYLSLFPFAQNSEVWKRLREPTAKAVSAYEIEKDGKR